MRRKQRCKVLGSNKMFALSRTSGFSFMALDAVSKGNGE